MNRSNHGWLRNVILLTALALAAWPAAPAAAQHNTLFSGNRASGHASPGANANGSAQNGAAAGASAGTNGTAGASAGAVAGSSNAKNAKSAKGGKSATGNLAVLSPDLPAVNETLLNVSPIAVELPKTRERRINVHDLLTIIVREDKRQTSDSKLETEKGWDLTAALTEWIRLDEDEHLVPQNFTRGQPSARFAYDNKYDGEGKLNRSDTLTMRITAEVIDVKPNGTLVLEARKSITHDEETQVMKLTGICRAEDITPENTVLSTQVADLNLSVDHGGAARDASKRGKIKKLADLLSIF